MAKRITPGYELLDSGLTQNEPIPRCVYDCPGGANGEGEEVISGSWSRIVLGDRHGDRSSVRATNQSHSIADTRHAVQVSGQGSAGCARRKVSPDQATPAARGCAQSGRTSAR